MSSCVVDPLKDGYDEAAKRIFGGKLVAFPTGTFISLPFHFFSLPFLLFSFVFFCLFFGHEHPPFRLPLSSFLRPLSHNHALGMGRSCKRLVVSRIDPRVDSSLRLFLSLVFNITVFGM